MGSVIAMTEVRELIDTEVDAVDVRELIDAELDTVGGGGAQHSESQLATINRLLHAIDAGAPWREPRQTTR